MKLGTPLDQLIGIGPGLSYKLKKLNLNTVEDLIYHFPFRYDDFSAIKSSTEAQIGEIVTLQGEIWSIKNIFTRYGKVLTQAIFNDGQSPVALTWFNQSWLTKQIKTGDRLQISGKLSKYKGKLSIMAPKWEKQLPTSNVGIHTGRLVPIYPETEGLTSKWVRTKIDQLLPQIENQIQDPLPNFIQDKMLDLPEAVKKIHFPQNYEDVQKAQERLGFDELFYISLATQKTRLAWREKPTVPPLQMYPNALEEFIKKLPFDLTNAQKKVIDEVLEDLKKDQPMNRMIQGEVGSGKTVVAAVIIYLLHLNNLKTLFMAPTEILAFQHFSTISRLLEPFSINVGIYTGSKKSIKNADVYIGTHALLSKKLLTQDVGLVIVDEQQRFGVQQRSFLRSRAKLPHFLTTTATPIPRTVALTLYGDLDLSVIDELPKNRQKIQTFVVLSKKRSDAYKFIEKKVKEGDQVYIITPLIEESETLKSVRAAKVEFERLQREVFPNLKLGLLHGRLKGKEKDQVMQDFKNFKIDILVSTSVVEVGMDVTNATIMVIESAERFGLAQLHQLRGRVGRGAKQSYCLLFTEIEEPSILNRLRNMEKIDDGMKLAELDLKIRGAGEILGTKQSGRFELKIADFSDIHLVEKTRKAASDILKIDPTLDKYPSLKAKLQNSASEVMPD
ncbi:ATP-dependent DNA helicase RecG [Candidatus Daviesbacteria bacterium]|nr:ATP-dependent DNA helicase RecG [Candidatus Daviesbacteria bacterium]